MNLCPKALLPHRILAILCVFAAGFLARADQIRFSKPVVPIAAPEKEEKEKLSRDHSKSLSFSEPTMEQPYVSQPQIIRIRPREPKEDDEESDSRDSRDPREATDPSEKYLRQGKESKSSARARNAPKQPRSSEAPGSKRPDGSSSDDPQSLSPVTDFTLSDREPGKRPGDSLFSSRNSTNRNDGRGRGSLQNREDSEQQNDKFRPLAFFDVRGARAKEKEQPSREVLEQRAAFQQLLNPNAGMAVKTPGSFEPVTVLDPPKPAIALKMPAMSGTAGAKPPESSQPFGGQQARLQPPMTGDAGKNAMKPLPAPGSAADPFRQAPLNRQPSTREFPTRKF